MKRHPNGAEFASKASEVNKNKLDSREDSIQRRLEITLPNLCPDHFPKSKISKYLSVR